MIIEECYTPSVILGLHKRHRNKSNTGERGYIRSEMYPVKPQFQSREKEDREIKLQALRSVLSGIPDTPQIWNSQSLYYTRSDPTMTYVERPPEMKTVVKWGQLKLIISEMQALLLFWKPEEVPHLTVVYAGAAPGQHFPIMASMFPNITWHLYDPAEFKIKPTDRIRLYREHFTDDIAAQWSNRRDVFFFSDIRTVSHKTSTSREVEIGVQKDMLDQQRWVQMMNPYKAHLKMRLPYWKDNNPGTFDYLYGYILYQSYSGPSSTETRLVPVRNAEGRYYKFTYDVKEYEERLFYHNAVTREKMRYALGPLPRDEDIGNNYDALHFLTVMDAYVRFTGYEPENRSETVLALTRIIRRQLADSLSTRPTLTKLRSPGGSPEGSPVELPTVIGT